MVQCIKSKPGRYQGRGQLTALDSEFVENQLANLLKNFTEIYFSPSPTASTVHVLVCTSIQTLPFFCLATAALPGPSLSKWFQETNYPTSFWPETQQYFSFSLSSEFCLRAPGLGGQGCDCKIRKPTLSVYVVWEIPTSQNLLSMLYLHL